MISIMISITPLSFDALSPMNLLEYRHKPFYIGRNLESLGYIFVADSIDLSSFIFSRWPPKDARVLKRSALWPFKVIQGHWFWHQSKAKARIWLPIRPQ